MAHCPVELNLMPESTLKWQRFNQKKPYFIASVFSLVRAFGLNKCSPLSPLYRRVPGNLGMALK
jgi:hypothetical protein